MQCYVRHAGTSLTKYFQMEVLLGQIKQTLIQALEEYLQALK